MMLKLKDIFLEGKVNEANASVIRNKLLKQFGNDPLYKDFIIAKTSKEQKKALATLKSIRGGNAIVLMQKYVKKLQGESVNEAKFSNDQIEIMRKAYGTLSRMDPSSPTYKKFIKFLDKLPKNQLKQLAGANIKWVSMLAKNRIKGESVNEKFVKYAPGQWVVFYEKGLKDIPIQVVGNAAAAKKLMNKLKGKYKNIGRSERKDFEKDNGKIKESIKEAPTAARAIQKQLGSELNNVSDDIIKITNKYKKRWPEVDADGMVRAWMKGLHSRLKRSGVKI